MEFGSIPDKKLILITSLRGLDSYFFKLLSILIGMLLDPQLLSVLIVLIISSMPSLQIGLGFINSHGGGRGLLLGPIVLSISPTTLVKKVVKMICYCIEIENRFISIIKFDS